MPRSSVFAPSRVRHRLVARFMDRFAFYHPVYSPFRFQLSRHPVDTFTL